ncbi:hypothetical protein ACF07Z_18685 [Streptomyces albidoflavus]
MPSYAASTTRSSAACGPAEADAEAEADGSAPAAAGDAFGAGAGAGSPPHPVRSTAQTAAPAAPLHRLNTRAPSDHEEHLGVRPGE